MKRLALFVALSLGLCCALAAVPALATEPAPADCTAPAIAGITADANGLPQPAIVQALSAKVDTAVGCTVQAACQNGLSVTCSASGSSASCSGVDANCSIGQRGSVTCNGSTTYCPVCPDDPPPSCWVQGAPCGSSAYCAAKCGAYCPGSDGGLCIAGACECYAAIE